jgi:hypothetical protein
MAVDTRNKRASCLGLDGAYRAVFPDPDGSLANKADRGHVAGKYSGIDASSPGGGGTGGGVFRSGVFGGRVLRAGGRR